MLSVKHSDSCKAVPSPTSDGTAIAYLWSTLLTEHRRVHSACGNHLNAACWICSRGRGRHGVSPSPFFNITHMQQKCIGTLRDFRGETSSTRALNRLLSNLTLVSKESSFLMWRRHTGSHAHFLCHLHSLEEEVKQKDMMKAFIPGTGKQGDVLGLQSAVNYNNFGNKLPSHPLFYGDSSYRKVLAVLICISARALAAAPPWENPPKHSGCAMGHDSLRVCGRVPQGLLEDSASCSFNCLREIVIIFLCLVECLPTTIKCNLQTKIQEKGFWMIWALSRANYRALFFSHLQLWVQFIIIYWSC